LALKNGGGRKEENMKIRSREICRERRKTTREERDRKLVQKKGGRFAEEYAPQPRSLQRGNGEKKGVSHQGKKKGTGKKKKGEKKNRKKRRRPKRKKVPNNKKCLKSSDIYASISAL